MKKVLVLLMLTILILAGCENKDDNNQMSMDELNVNPEFEFNTTMQVSLNLTSQDADGNITPNAPFALYKQNPDRSEGSRILQAATNDAGYFEHIIMLPAYYRTIYLRSGQGEVQTYDLNVIDTAEAELNTIFTYNPLDIKGIKNGKSGDKFEAITVSDNGFDFTLHSINSDCFNYASLVFSIKNNNDKGFSHGKFGLPAGAEAASPEDGDIYETTNYSYDIENPTNNPFRAISFETRDEDGFKNGNSDFFTYLVDLSYFDTWNSVQIEAKAANIVGQVTIDFTFDPSSCTFFEFYPSEEEYGTLAFEDNWPSEGDYDINDLVIDYNFAIRYNAAYERELILAEFKLRAIGASYDLGFAFQLPEDLIVNDEITSTNGLAYVEADNRTVVVFDHARDVITENPGQFINTDPVLPHTPTQTIGLAIPVEENWGKMFLPPWYMPPYNPFIFANNRANEIHLPDYAPTAEANTELFGTADDGSNPSEYIYYRTKNYLPWAFHIAESTVYPIEKTPMIDAFTHFADWVNSDGWNYQDWYKNEPGYRNNDLIYQEP